MINELYKKIFDKLEIYGLKRSYWGKKILAAVKRGHFTDPNGRQALSWVTCACGRSDVEIAVDSSGEPRDAQLAELGINFSIHVDFNEFENAADTLIDIQLRAVYLVKEARES